ncbi:MAG: hypothetical protein R3F55_07785 [Alphaproteobacteria bacterium]
MPFGKKTKELGQEVGTEAVMIGVSQAGAALEEATGFPITLLLEAGFTLKEIYDAAEKTTPIPNPLLLLHGHGDGASPETRKYLQHRKYKKMGSAAFSFVGTGFQVAQDIAGFGVGGVDTFGLAKHGLSEASTLAHLARFAALANQVKQSTYLRGLVMDMIKVKAAKAGIRGGKIAAAAIPNSIASNVVSAAVGLGAAATSVLIKELVNRVSVEVHWRAFQELKVGSAFGGGYGPACKMAQELMNHIVSTDFVPTGKVRTFLLEPAGYLVIKDKLGML